MNYLDNIMHPEGYHGNVKNKTFFEGWYFKLVDASGKFRYAIIPGVSLSQGDIGPHCFIQALDGSSGTTEYHTFPLDMFSAEYQKMDIEIGPNRFNAAGMTLNLPGSKLNIQGHVDFSKLQPWPVKWHAPGIMGWYAWVPFMECYHGVLSFDHSIQGSIQINNVAVDFTGGRGYIEKDWGKSFPSGWIWMQSNHFSTPGTSFVASIAMIPWIGSSFRGFIIGLLHEGNLLRFATYTGAITESLTTLSDSVSWYVANRNYRLQINAHRAVSGNLRGPSRTDMARRVPETLQAQISLKLTSLSDDRVIFEDTGFHGGLEIGGDQTRLTQM